MADTKILTAEPLKKLSFNKDTNENKSYRPSVRRFLRPLGVAGETLASYFPQIQNDLTKITWSHAVNSRGKLKEALESDVLMLEADVVLGHTSAHSKDNNDEKVPVMAHPPETISDLTLEEFIQIFESKGVNKGIKLDFKSRDAFAQSDRIIEKIFTSFQTDYPVLLNADIIPGPVNGSKDVVDADYFLSQCISRYPGAIISVGWSTSLAPGSTEGKYREDDIARMTEALNKNMVLISPVTFAVRAALAARSVDLLTNLIASSSSDSTTLTIWSSVDTDVVDIDGLRTLIKKVGVDRTCLDLPQSITDKLKAKESSSAAYSIGPYLLVVSLVPLLSFFYRT